MNTNEILAAAQALNEEMQEKRRTLHEHPETGFDLEFTKAFVKAELEKLGINALEMGKAGLIACIGGKAPGKCILVRADMDALPMEEETDEPFKSKNPGKMHACGHDMHTAMLLGAAKILKEHEDEIEGTVKLEFQPAEEIFQGSSDMIAAGLLENPHVDAAIMLHVVAGIPVPSGCFMVPSCGGLTTTSCEQYHITVTGKGGHGSAPHAAIDPITAAAQIHLALQEINSRELSPDTYGVFTTCKFTAGQTSNVIPDTAEMWGTIRTADESGEVTSLIHKRMTEITTGLATAMRCTSDIEFFDFCPCMRIDDDLAKAGYKYMTDMMGQPVIPMVPKPQTGSEDFAFVSLKVPTFAMYLVAGSSNDGYNFGQHNPKVRFDDSKLYLGTAAYVQLALNWLKEHK